MNRVRTYVFAYLRTCVFGYLRKEISIKNVSTQERKYLSTFLDISQNPVDNESSIS